jgi:hypothetical protein
MMADFPEQAKFLSPQEQKFVIARLKKDQGAAGEAVSGFPLELASFSDSGVVLQGFSWGHITSACKDYRVWLYCLIYMGVAEPLYSLALFVPTIIASLGKFTRAESQLLSTPPYFLAFGITL